MKTTWKTYEEAMRQAETGLSRPKFWWMMMNSKSKGQACSLMCLTYIQILWK